MGSSCRRENLGVFAEDFGVEADPVVGDEHLALVQDVPLQGARVACRPRRSQLASGNGELPAAPAGLERSERGLTLSEQLVLADLLEQLVVLSVGLRQLVKGQEDKTL